MTRLQDAIDRLSAVGGGGLVALPDENATALEDDIAVVLAALSTPPADDVREAAGVLVETAIREEQKRIAALPESMKTWTGEQFRAWSNGMSNAARIARGALETDPEVRPHGTVTDAERSAINGALIDMLPLWTDSPAPARTDFLNGIVRALEAAREVHP